MRRYLEINLLLLAESGESFTAGANCKLSDEASVDQSVLWDNVSVASGARVKRAILGDNVKIAAGEVIEDAAVVCASLIQGKAAPPKALRGELRGHNFVVPLTE